MEIQNIIAIFLLISSTIAFPSKPLDERSTELTWQAWLLVDDQNQNKQNNEGGNMKKKVIAKSVFIVPTFNPEKLPPCADGYASDSMGRCLEVFQVDPKNQLEFLFSKLQNQLGSSHKISTGPEKFTIEIPGNDGGHDDTSAALVLTQNPKADEKHVHNMVVPVEHPDLPKVKIEDKNSEEATETTTLTPTTSTSTETEPPTTDQPATEPIFSTLSSSGSEETYEESTLTTTFAVPAEDDDDTTETTPTTLVTEDNRQAIFFKLPSTQDSEQPSDFTLSSRIQFKDDAYSNDQPTQDSTNLDYDSSSRVIFRDQQDDGDLLTSENVRHTTNVVRFPDNTNSYNHRNRDKNFWRLKPSWKESERNSFLVNLSNINFNDLLVQNRHSSMYRQIPSEHLSYIFGRKGNRR